MGSEDAGRASAPTHPSPRGRLPEALPLGGTSDREPGRWAAPGSQPLRPGVFRPREVLRFAYLLMSRAPGPRGGGGAGARRRSVSGDQGSRWAPHASLRPETLQARAEAKSPSRSPAPGPRRRPRPSPPDPQSSSIPRPSRRPLHPGPVPSVPLTPPPPSHARGPPESLRPDPGPAHPSSLPESWWKGPSAGRRDPQGGPVDDL